MFFFYCRYCVFGMGMGRGGIELFFSSEMDDNLFFSEVCYECKINGYFKRGRKRRSINEIDVFNIKVG